MIKYLNAYKQKQRSDFEVLNPDYNETDASYSAHSLELWAKTKSPDVKYVFKSYVMVAKKHRRKAGMAQIEAALGDFYRFLLGPDRAPKMRVVCEGTEDLGVVSKMIPGFTSFRDRVDAGWQPVAEELAQAGLGSLLAASWILQEKDLSLRNFGFNAEGKLVKIDNDKGLAVITKKICYPTKDTTQVEENLGKISSGDMENLVTPAVYRPTNWLNQHAADSGSIAIKKTLLAAETHAAFSFDKWKTMVKASMLTPEMIRAIFSSHIENTDTVEVLTEYLSQRLKTIAAAMLTVEDCVSTIGRDYAKLTQVLDDEINLYNEEFAAQPERRIPLTFESEQLQYLDHVLQEQELNPSAALTAENLARLNYQ